MSGAHLHLILNHLPLLGVIFAIPLLVITMRKPSPDLQKAALVMFTLSGLISPIVHLSGEQGEQELQNWPGISREVIFNFCVRPKEERCILCKI